MRVWLTIMLVLFCSQHGWTEETMEAKKTDVLVVYGTFGGSTKIIASSFKNTLTAQNCRVEMMEAADKEVPLTAYDLIIIGSAIHGNRPHENVLKFIDRNRAALEKKPIAVFAACCTISSYKESKLKNALTYPTTIAHGLKPMSEAVFASDVPSDGWFNDMMADVFLGVKPGKYRDWKKINGWASSLPGMLSTKQAVAR